MCQKRSSPGGWKDPRAQHQAGLGWNSGYAKDSLYLPGDRLPHLGNRFVWTKGENVIYAKHQTKHLRHNGGLMVAMISSVIITRKWLKYLVTFLHGHYLGTMSRLARVNREQVLRSLPSFFKGKHQWLQCPDLPLIIQQDEVNKAWQSCPFIHQ